MGDRRGKHDSDAGHVCGYSCIGPGGNGTAHGDLPIGIRQTAIALRADVDKRFDPWIDTMRIRDWSHVAGVERPRTAVGKRQSKESIDALDDRWTAVAAEQQRRGGDPAKILRTTRPAQRGQKVERHLVHAARNSGLSWKRHRRIAAFTAPKIDECLRCIVTMPSCEQTSKMIHEPHQFSERLVVLWQDTERNRLVQRQARDTVGSGLRESHRNQSAVRMADHVDACARFSEIVEVARYEPDFLVESE